MSLFKRLFGGGSEAPTSARHEAVEYKGFLIQPAPQADGGQYRVAGTIRMADPQDGREHRFIRADLFPDETGAADTMVRKAQTMVDQLGERLFD